MTTLFAFLFAQSLLGDLSKGAATPAPAEPVAAPYAVADAEANAAVLQKQQQEEKAAEPEEAAKEEPAIETPSADAAPDAEDATNVETAPIVETVPAVEAEPIVEAAPAAEAEPAAEQAPETESPLAALGMPRSVKITSERTDYDRREGVIMFDKDVFVDDAEYKMHSDQLYVFLDGTNELKRIVAIGNVSITNETRVGSCAKAAYTKSVGKVVMYGDSNGVRAKLADYGKRKSEVEGRKITFWIDSEQVEVEGSTVTLDASGYGGKEGAKKLLGK